MMEDYGLREVWVKKKSILYASLRGIAVGRRHLRSCFLPTIFRLTLKSIGRKVSCTELIKVL